MSFVPTLCRQFSVQPLCTTLLLRAMSRLSPASKLFPAVLMLTVASGCRFGDQDQIPVSVYRQASPSTTKVCVLY